MHARGDLESVRFYARLAGLILWLHEMDLNLCGFESCGRCSARVGVTHARAQRLHVSFKLMHFNAFEK